MFFYHLHQVLRLLWQLSTVYVIPIIIILYIKALNLMGYPLSFSELDEGQNIHKLAILGIYLLYLLIWKLINKYVISLLNKLKFR